MWLCPQIGERSILVEALSLGPPGIHVFKRTLPSRFASFFDAQNNPMTEYKARRDARSCERENIVPFRIRMAPSIE